MAKKQVPREKHARARNSDSSPNNHRDENARGIRSKLHSRKKRQENTTQIMFVAACCTSVVVLVASVGVYFWYSAYMRELVRMPLNVPKMVEENSTLASADPERFWGSYRPGAYFGMKTRSPFSPVYGFMWINQFQKNPDSPPTLRHWCSQSDDIPKYGWTAHDGVNFGTQEIFDHYYAIVMDYVKRPGGKHGGDWSTRMRVIPRFEDMPVVLSFFFYMALDAEAGHPDGHEYIAAEMSDANHISSIRGFSPHLGAFRLTFPDQDATTVRSNYLITHASGLDKLHEILGQSVKYDNFGVKRENTSSDTAYKSLVGKKLPKGFPVERANFIVSQVTFAAPFEIEIVFESESVESRPDQLIGEAYQALLESHQANFNQRFDDVFALRSKGFNDEYIGFAKAALSNMLGGIGYFYGSSLVSSRRTEEPVDYWPSALYTAVPSRSFFPRGFLWDEGFHNILIVQWNQKISMDIIAHWLDLMNMEGWIPREQILGGEARARVPQEFIVQRNVNANPPTLFLPLRIIVSNILADPNDTEGHQYLRNLFPRLRTWYNWYEQTQAGPLNSTYRWRGRNATSVLELNPKTLTSGLDDYPRSSHPSVDERHIDLRCWMALASDVMADIARAVNETYLSEYTSKYQLLSNNELLDEMHWSERTQRYSDYGLHTDDVRLERPKVPKIKPKPGSSMTREKVQKDMVRVTRSEPALQFIDSGFGYVNLFPFLLKIVAPDSVKLGRTFEDMHERLWTPYGLRSLEANSPLYGKHNTEHDPPYWRGSIWININYLAISALHHYAGEDGPYRDTAQELYTELRMNVIKNIFNQYNETGYIWEQYHDDTGKGKGTHPFTGWSALVVSIMAEQFF